LIGSLLGLLVTAGWFAMLPKEMLRLTHPGMIGKFAPGIFAGMLGQIVAMLLTDVAGFVATVQNYRNKEQVAHSSKVVLRIFGAIFVIMGVMIIVTKLHADHYNLMHLTWGALAIGASFMTVRVTKLFPASANSPADISPAGSPPAIATACSFNTAILPLHLLRVLSPSADYGREAVTCHKPLAALRPNRRGRSPIPSLP
jgi:hypothetical protein